MGADKNWVLEKLTIQFKKGYSFDDTHDRYEGVIEFQNGDKESFTVKLREDMTEPYLKLVSKEVANNAQELADRMAKLLTFKSE